MLDAIVIGAGPAGIGSALALGAVDGLDVLVLERGAVGQTFLDWPAEQTFLTPSFTGNGFGATDLNSVHPETSPAFTLGVDYPTGPQYAKYLRSVAAHFRVPVRDSTSVLRVTRTDDGFAVDTDRGALSARNVVWAGGEFDDRRLPRIPGAGLAAPAGAEEAWRPRSGPVVVIGGYESGVDIASRHALAGNPVTMVDGAAPWDAGRGSDPSYRLAPRSRMRLRRALDTGNLSVVAASAIGIKRAGDRWRTRLRDGTTLESASAPIAATGYGPGLGPVDHLFAVRDDGWPLLDDDDQSTIAPGLFLSGPAIRHGALKFCFVYKFRQRFAHIARVIGDREGKDVGALEAWRDAGMLTDDLSCCGTECAC